MGVGEGRGVLLNRPVPDVLASVIWPEVVWGFMGVGWLVGVGRGGRGYLFSIW